MKIAILGATGRTGYWLVEEALNIGHEVNVLVRDPGRLKSKSSLLKIHIGRPNDPKVLSETIKGCDAVISALNISRTSDFPWARLRAPKDLLSSTMRTLIETAQNEGIERIITTSASGVGDSVVDLPGWFNWLIANSNIRYPYADHEKQEELLRASNLKWTAVRPVGLTNHRRVKEVQVSFQGKPRPKMTISRRNTALFILNQLENDQFIHECPTLSEQ